jgi:hypothetical protein
LGEELGKIHSITFDKFGDVHMKNNSIVVGEVSEFMDVNQKIKRWPFNLWK